MLKIGVGFESMIDVLKVFVSTGPELPEHSLLPIQIQFC